MDSPRHATPEDVPMLARLHVQAWAETYAGLLPATEIARHDLALRQAQWTHQITAATSRIMLVPDLGFAQVGPQREDDLRGDWPSELYAIYLLRRGQGQGHGRALLRAALGPSPTPFTALALAGNGPAHAFYTRAGATCIAIRPDPSGAADLADCVYAWRNATAV